MALTVALRVDIVQIIKHVTLKLGIVLEAAVWVGKNRCVRELVCLVTMVLTAAQAVVTVQVTSHAITRRVNV